MKQLLFILLMSWAAHLPGQEIIIPPIEQDPKDPSISRDINGQAIEGNWGYYQLAIDALYGQITSMARRPVLVYVFDTGGKLSHPGLAKAVLNDRGRTFTGEAAPEDGNGHSTHVSSTYAGEDPSGKAVGVCAPLLAKGLIKIIPIKVLTNGGSGTFAYTNAALDAVLPEVKAAIAGGAFVVYNFSLGGGTAILPDTEIRLKAAQASGVLVVAAAGNSGAEGVIYPAVGVPARAVASLTLSGGQLSRSSFSTFGDEVEYATPGQSIYGCWPPNLYKELSGTSMATPHAGAIAAIIASCYPTATAEQVAAHMAKFVVDLGDTGRDKYYGYGLPDVAAMLATPPGSAPDPDPDPDPDPGPGPDPGYPERTMPMSLPQTFTVPWQILNDPSGKVYRLTFKVSADYTTKKGMDQAAEEFAAITREHFRSRGYILPVGSDSYQAAYWVAYFYRLILGKEGYKVTVTAMDMNVSGVNVVRRNFTAGAGKVSERKVRRAGAYTVTDALFE